MLAILQHKALIPLHAKSSPIAPPTTHAPGSHKKQPRRCSARRIPPTAAESSESDAVQFELGSGDALITASTPGFKAWCSAARAPR